MARQESTQAAEQLLVLMTQHDTTQMPSWALREILEAERTKFTLHIQKY